MGSTEGAIARSTAMTIIFTADLHLSENPRDAYRHDFMNSYLPSVLREKDAEGLVILGDLTEEKDGHGSWLVNKVVQHLKNATAICPVLFLPGNHDYTNPDHPFFEFLKHVPGITWVRTPCMGGELPPPWCDLLPGSLFLPHTRRWQEDWKEFHLDDDRYDFIFAHQTFNGANVGFGRKMEGIPLDVFREDARVISGDIHVPQKLGPVTYVGAPYHVDFGDDYEGRFLILRGDKITRLRIGHNVRQKRAIEAASLKEMRAVAKEDCREGDVLRIRYHIKDPAKWPETKAAIMEWAQKCPYVVHQVQPVFEEVRTRKDRVRMEEQEEGRTDIQVLEDYARKHGIDDKTLAVGKEIVEAA